MSEIAPLYPYQRLWIEDRSQLKAGLWCRSAGKTFAVMLEAVIDCQEAEVEGRRVSWFVFSGAEPQTKEMLRYAAIHAKAIALAFTAFEEVEELDGKKFTNHIVEFPGGSRIVGLPTNPLSIRGRHGNLIWDEAGKTPQDEEVWSAAAPIAGRIGLKLRMVGTPGAKRGPFFEVIAGKLPGWSRHRIDVHQAIEEGAPLDLDKIRAVSRGRAFITEYLCEFEDEEARLLSLERILSCEDASTLLVPFLRIDDDSKSAWQPHLDRQHDSAPSAGYDTPRAWWRLFQPLALGDPRDLYFGFDVARSGHLSVLWIVETDGLFRRTRAVVAFKGRRYAEQKAALWAAIANCRRGCIDSTGLGSQMAEEAVEAWGEHRVEPVLFSLATKEDMAVRLVRGYEDATHRIPPSTEIRDSLHSVYKVTTAAGHARYDADATEEAGHADYFWAQALSCMAAGDGAREPFIESFNRRTWSRNVEAF